MLLASTGMGEENGGPVSSTNLLVAVNTPPSWGLPDPMSMLIPVLGCNPSCFPGLCGPQLLAVKLLSPMGNVGPHEGK